MGTRPPSPKFLGLYSLLICKSTKYAMRNLQTMDFAPLGLTIGRPPLGAQRALHRIML